MPWQLLLGSFVFIVAAWIWEAVRRSKQKDSPRDSYGEIYDSQSEMQRLSGNVDAPDVSPETHTHD